MKKISRRSFVKAAGTALALTALTACGGSSSSTAASGTASSAASGSTAASSEALSADVQAIVDRGVLKVGVKNAVKGFSFQDTITGEYSGLEDSLAEMIAEHLGVDVEFTTVTAATRGELLDSGDIDCVLATFTITDERRKSWDFSTPYYTDYVSVLVEDSSGIKALADLKDKVVGVSSGSTSARALVQEMIDEGILTGEGTPDYARCVAISTRGAQREMLFPSLLAIAAPVVVGLVFGVAGVMGLLVGGLSSGFVLAVFMANAGGAWDNAKKMVEEGHFGGKGSDCHRATVVGDTVGDPFKDTSGPSLNILIKLMSMVSIVMAGLTVAFHLF